MKRSEFKPATTLNMLAAAWVSGIDPYGTGGSDDLRLIG